MSKFLGPIHYWLHNKITGQEQMELAFENAFKSSLEPANLNEWQSVETALGYPTPTESLEQVIDSTNIHGWLQGRITKAETRFAHKFGIVKVQFPEQAYETVQTLLKESAIEDVAAIKESGSWNGQLDHAYKLLNNYVLEGMPCDHAGAVIENSDNKLVWQTTKCLHKAYWDAAGGDVKDHYFIRDAYSSEFFRALGNIDYRRTEESGITRYELTRA